MNDFMAMRFHRWLAANSMRTRMPTRRTGVVIAALYLSILAAWSSTTHAEVWTKGVNSATNWVDDGPPRFAGWIARNAGGQCDDKPFHDPKEAFECSTRLTGLGPPNFVYPALRAPGPTCGEANVGDSVLSNGDKTVRFLLRDTRPNSNCPNGTPGYDNDAIPVYECPAGSMPGEYLSYPNQIDAKSGVPFWLAWSYSYSLRVCAHRVDSAEQPNPKKEAGKPANCGKGDPCEPFSGNQYETVVDYSAPTTPLLRFVRTYNSLGGASSETASLGQKWRHNFQSSVRVARTYSYPTGAQVATVVRPDGKQFDFFRAAPTVGWSAPADRDEELVDLAGGGWKFTSSSGVVETYNDRGQLAKVEDGAGYYLDLNYELQPAPIAGQVSTDYELASVIDRFGRKLQFFYNGDGKIGSVQLPAFAGQSARTISFQYKLLSDGGHALEKVTYPDGRFVTYEYTNTAFPSALTRVVDENGVATTHVEYDATGRVSRNYVTAGQFEDMQFVRTGNSVTITDAFNVQRTYVSEVKHGVRRFVANSANATCSHCAVDGAAASYDANGRVTSRTDFNGNITRYVVDALGREVCKLEGIAGSGQNDDKAYRLTISVWPGSRVPQPTMVTTFEPTDTTMAPPSTCPTDLAGWAKRKEVETAYVAGTTRIDWTEERSFPSDVNVPPRRTDFIYYGEAGGDPVVLAGLLKKVDGPRQLPVLDVTQFNYALGTDSNHFVGDMTEIVNPLGHTTLVTQHDADGRALAVKAPNDLDTIFAYDPRGRLVSQSVEGVTTPLSRDPAGLLKRIARPTGDYVRFEYDAAHRLTDTFVGYLLGSDHDLEQEHHELDALGNWTHQTRYQGSSVKWHRERVFNALGLEESFVPGAGGASVFTYDANGNKRKAIDPRDPGNQSVFKERSYDAMNRVRKIRDALGASTELRFDVFDNIRSVKSLPAPAVLEPTYETVYQRSAFGDVLALTSPDTGATGYQYDAAGNQVRLTDARHTVSVPTESTYAYDALNRLTSISYPSPDPGIIYTYDSVANGNKGLGRLTGITDGSGSTAYTYDVKGNVTSQLVNIGSVAKNISYTYDAADRLTAVTYPSGRVIKFIRPKNAGGRVGAVTTVNGGVTSTIIANLQYAPFGPVTKYRFGNGVQYTKSLDADYRVTRVTHGILLDLEPVPDVAGNYGAIVDRLDASRSRTFSYDFVDRLKTVADGTGLTHDITYNHVGDRATLGTAMGAQTYSYVAGKRWLDNVVGGANYSHDDAGNTTARDSDQFTYDKRGRMRTFVKGGATTTYTYNGRGERVKKVKGSNTTLYFFDIYGQLVAEADGAGAIQKEYAFLDGELIAILTTDADQVASVSDSDGDGITNLDEVRYGLDPGDPTDASIDLDNDGLTNAQEIASSTDIDDADTDSDGLTDGADSSPLFNPGAAAPILRQLINGN